MIENSIPFTMEAWQTGEYDTYMVNGIQVNGLLVTRNIVRYTNILMGNAGKISLWYENGKKYLSYKPTSEDLILVKKKQP